MPPPRRSCQVEATGPPEAWWRLFSSGLRFCPAPSGTGSLPGWFHAPSVSTLGPGTAGRLLRGDALALGPCQARRASAEEPGRTREHCPRGEGLGGLAACAHFPPRAFAGSTLVSAVRGLLSFLSSSLPHLSQSESLRGPNVTWAFLIRLRRGKQGHPLGGQSSQPRSGSFRLEESPLAAEVRVCLPCVCNSLIFEDTFLAASSEPWHRAGPGRVPAEANRRGALPRAPQSVSPFLCL